MRHIIFLALLALAAPAAAQTTTVGGVDVAEIHTGVPTYSVGSSHTVVAAELNTGRAHYWTTGVASATSSTLTLAPAANGQRYTVVRNDTDQAELILTPSSGETIRWVSEGYALDADESLWGLARFAWALVVGYDTGVLDVYTCGPWISSSNGYVSTWTTINLEIQAQSISNASWTAIDLSDLVTRQDDADLLAISTGTLTLPPGTWRFSATTSWFTPGTGNSSRRLRILLGGTEYARDQDEISGAFATSQSIAGGWTLSSDTAVLVQVYQDEGSAVSAGYTHFSATKVGP